MGTVVLLPLPEPVVVGNTAAKLLKYGDPGEAGGLADQSSKRAISERVG